MNDKPLKVLFLYSGRRQGLLDQVRRGETHGDGFWGMVELQKLGVDASYVEIEDVFSPKVAAFLRKHINVYFLHIFMLPRILRSDLVFTSAAFGVQFLVGLLPLCRPFRRPRWVMHDFSIAGFLTGKSAVKRAIFRRLVRTSAGIVTLSEAEKQRLITMMPELAPKIAHVPFGIDLEYFKPQTAQEKRQILGVGNDPDRDWKTLIEATAGLDVKLIITANPKRLAKLQPLPVHVELRTFEPPRALLQAYSESALIAVPLDISKGNNEAMGSSSVCEAMAMGRTVIATRTPNIESYVAHGQNGVSVEQGDVTGMRTEIKRLLDDGATRAVIGKNARTYAETHLDAMKNGRKLKDFFYNL